MMKFTAFSSKLSLYWCNNILVSAVEVSA